VHGDTRLIKPPGKDPHHIESAAAGGEKPAAALFDKRQVVVFEKGYQFFGKKMLESLAEKPAVSSELVHKIIEPGAVGQVAPAFAADPYFSARLRHFFKEHDPGPSLGGPAGCHHPRGTSTYDDSGPASHLVFNPP
jgi:hypothetical protein